MTPQNRIAITLPAGPKVADTLEFVTASERAGFTDAWFADGSSPDSLTLCAALSQRTSKIRIGVAVTPVFTRTPAVLAATANALEQLMPGRFVLGLGSSSHNIVEGWNGVQFERPLTRVRETLQMVQSMLRGEKSDFRLETLRSRGYRQMPLNAPPPVYVGAHRPKMIEMAAEFADGLIFNLWPKGALAKMLEHKAVGARRAGKDPDSIEVVNRAMALVTDDKGEARTRFRAAFAPYYATPVYNKFLSWAGYESVAAEIREGWAARDRARTTNALSDELVDEIAVIGSADECRERIRWNAASGVHTNIIAPLGASPEDTRRTVEAFAPGVFEF